MLSSAHEYVGALREAAFARLRQVARDDFEARLLTGALVETIVHWVETDLAEDPRALAVPYASFAKGVRGAGRGRRI